MCTHTDSCVKALHNSVTACSIPANTTRRATHPWLSGQHTGSCFLRSSGKVCSPSMLAAPHAAAPAGLGPRRCCRPGCPGPAQTLGGSTRTSCCHTSGAHQRTYWCAAADRSPHKTNSGHVSHMGVEGASLAKSSWQLSQGTCVLCVQLQLVATPTCTAKTHTLSGRCLLMARA